MARGLVPVLALGSRDLANLVGDRSDKLFGGIGVGSLRQIGENFGEINGRVLVYHFDEHLEEDIAAELVGLGGDLGSTILVALLQRIDNLLKEDS